MKNCDKIRNDLILKVEAQIDGYQTTALMYLAVKAGIIDVLADDPKSVEQISKELHVHSLTLSRVLKALVSLGFCHESSEAHFSLTKSGEFLQSNAEYPLHAKVLNAVEQYWESWGEALYSLKTGKPAFAHVHNCSPWEYRQKYTDMNASFNLWMMRESEQHTNAILEAINISDQNVIADIAGGGGGLLLPILRKHPYLTGVLFDQPHVIAQFNKELFDLELSNRISTVSGNFFQKIPLEADVFFLKSILHDWDDAQCVEILMHCKDAMKSTSKLLIIERLLDDNLSSTYMVDMTMLLITGGKERTLNEYQSLMYQSGLQINDVRKTSSPFYVIEGTLR